MKRRLFLKNGGLGIAGIAVAPAIFSTGCDILKDIDTTPPVKLNPLLAEGLEFYSEGAEFFDLAVAELRIAGNGPFSPAEAEAYDLTEVTEQIYQQAEVQAEIPIDFAESAQEIMDASQEMLGAAPELVPIPKGGHGALAEDFAFLKVLKATAILHSASEVDPFNTIRADVSEKMFNAANEVYTSLEGNMPAEDNLEVIEASEALLAYSEEYVGVCETFSGLEGFEDALAEFGRAEEEFAKDQIGEGAGHLFAASENLALSAEYHVEGLYNLNAEAELFNSPAENMAEELVPFLDELVSESRSFMGLAEGESAELGAAEMLYGAEVMRDTAESDAFEIYWGGEAFELGAEQFLAGTLNFYGAQAYNDAASEYLKGAESIERFPRGNAQGEHMLAGGAMELYKASESIFVSAEALEFIGGEYYVIETPEIIESGPEVIEVYNSVYSGGENPEVIKLAPNNFEIISPDPVEFIRPRTFEIAGELFRMPPGPEMIMAETTETEFVYKNAELGTANLIPAAEDLFEGAELMESIEERFCGSFARRGCSELGEGAFEMIEGSEYSITGAVEMFETPEWLQDGGQHIEDGAFELMNGAAEYVIGLEQF